MFVRFLDFLFLVNLAYFTYSYIERFLDFALLWISEKGIREDA